MKKIIPQKTDSISIKKIAQNPRVQAVSLFLLVLISRIPFRSRILYHWDSVNFAFGLGEFNVAIEQPQPPGYILYVWFARFVDGFINNPQTTMVAISVVASALTAAALYVLGLTMFNQSVGLISALFFSFSPLFWFYGEIALPHTLDTLFVVLSVTGLYQVMNGKQEKLYIVIILLSIAGGIRQQTIIFIIPVLLYSFRRLRWERFTAAGLLGVVLCLIWFIPLIESTNGLANYLSILGDYSDRFQISTSVFKGAGIPGLARNISKLVKYTLYGWGIAAFPALAYIFWRVKRKESRILKEKLFFCMLWILPSILFYVFIHMGQQGLIFIFLPALMLFSAASINQVWRTQPKTQSVLVALIVSLNIGVFLMLSEYPLGPNNQRILTYDTVKNSDQYYQERFNEITKEFDENTTVLLATSWHHLEYYLPDYSILRFRTSDTDPEHVQRTITADLGTYSLDELSIELKDDQNGSLVLFDPILGNFIQENVPLQYRLLPSGNSLFYVTLAPDDQIRIQEESFTILSK